MDCETFARKVLVKSSPRFAAHRFEQINYSFMVSWGNNPNQYRAALKMLPDDEQGIANRLFDLTLEWLVANETRQAEIDEQGNALIAQLNGMGSRWFVELLDIFAPYGTALRAEWELCAESLSPNV